MISFIMIGKWMRSQYGKADILIRTKQNVTQVVMHTSEVQREGADCYYHCGSPWYIAFKSMRLDEIQRESVYLEKEAHQHFEF